MNTKLITALRLTATALEQGTFNYDWKNLQQCNCGALFCALSGRSSAQLSAVTKPFHLSSDGGSGTWTQLVGYWCPITGMTTNKLFVELFGYGLTPLDITELEYLKNPAVLARVGRKLDYRKAADAAAYMRAWAALLAEQGRGDGPAEPAPVPAPEPVQVQYSTPPTAPRKLSLRARMLSAIYHLNSL